MTRTGPISMLGIVSWLVGLAGCLPSDTRPEPGTATLYALPDESLLYGFMTEDGWQVTFDEFFISLGDGDLGGDACNQYSESDYLRILDMLRPGTQRLATLYALGNCEMSFRIRAPGRSALLGQGVEDDIKTFMRTTGSDGYVDDRGANLHVSGTAQGVEGTFRFTWTFRRDIEYTQCGPVAFESGQSGEIRIHVLGDALFRTDGSSSPLRFGAYAAADNNGDGDITLEELGAVPIEGEGPFGSLADRLYLKRAPAVAHLDGASCVATGLDDD